MIAAAAARRQDRKHQEWSRRNAALFTDSVEEDLRAALADSLKRRHAEQEEQMRAWDISANDWTNFHRWEALEK